MKQKMEWITVTLEDGRQRHSATTKTRRLYVDDWLDGRIDWYVEDETGNAFIDQGKSASADEAKAAAEQAAQPSNERQTMTADEILDRIQQAEAEIAQVPGTDEAAYLEALVCKLGDRMANLPIDKSSEFGL